MANVVKIVCKNVFKNNSEMERTEAFNMKWIELINQYEKKGTPCEMMDK